MACDPPSLTLDIEGWEGPLDLLLALARAQKVDLRAISFVELVDQYLAFLDAAAARRLDLAADYLVMAAWLAYLKSALLLPREPTEAPDPEELTLRLRLRLVRHEAMREAGARLMARDRLGRDVFVRGAPEGLRTVRRAALDAELYDLIAAYGRVSARTRPVLHVVADREVVTLETALARVAALVGEKVDWTRIERFLPPGSDRLRTSALASSFLAALELAKQGRIELRQRAPFPPRGARPSADLCHHAGVPGAFRAGEPSRPAWAGRSEGGGAARSRRSRARCNALGRCAGIGGGNRRRERLDIP